MINFRRPIITCPIASTDVWKDVLIPVNKRQGYRINKAPVLPIYFYFLLGNQAGTKENYLQQLSVHEESIKKSKAPIKTFIGSIPTEYSIQMEAINKTNLVWNKQRNLDMQGVSALGEELISQGVLPSFSDRTIQDTCSEAFSRVLQYYCVNEKNITMTTLKNFGIKLLTWIKAYVPNLLQSLNLSSEAIINPKVVYGGDLKKHDAYFLLYLYMVGCDVIYVSPKKEDTYYHIPQIKVNSKLMDYGKYDDITLTYPFIQQPTRPQIQQQVQVNRANTVAPASRPMQQRPAVQQPRVPQPRTQQSRVPQPRTARSGITYKDENVMNASLKEAMDLFQEILEPMKNRIGYLGEPMPVLPIYFYQYLGFENSEDEYFNKLYSLDKKLAHQNLPYVLYKQQVLLGQNMKLVDRINQAWRVNGGQLGEQDIKNIICDIKEAGLLQFNKNLRIEDSLLKSLEQILITEKSLRGQIGASQAKNLCSKLIIWLDEALNQKMKCRFTYTTDGSENPKVIFYGNQLKRHESYLMLMYSAIGCDILLLNPEGDDLFEDIYGENSFGKVIKLPSQCDLKPFPTTEVLVRSETTAFRASREIGEIIHNDQDGVYRPWQFESYFVQPLTLRTTYEELFILWNENARMRSSFKVENNTIYVPNIFTKISGTHEDLNQYWREIKLTTQVKYKKLFKHVPFTRSTYSEGDHYTLSYLINNDGLVNERELKKNVSYPFKHLKTPLQEMIIKKINQLMQTEMLIGASDKNYRLRILKAIMNMDSDILRLIQQFDYPFSIPKIIIYDGVQDIFSHEDAIVLAFLNLMGFDIVIFTPTGYNNIEDKISQRYYDTHKLENIQFDLAMPDLNRVSMQPKSGSKFWSNLFRG